MADLNDVDKRVAELEKRLNESKPEPKKGFVTVTAGTKATVNAGQSVDISASLKTAVAASSSMSFGIGYKSDYSFGTSFSYTGGPAWQKEDPKAWQGKNSKFLQAISSKIDYSSIKSHSFGVAPEGSSDFLTKKTIWNKNCFEVFVGEDTQGLEGKYAAGAFAAYTKTMDKIANLNMATTALATTASTGPVIAGAVDPTNEAAHTAAKVVTPLFQLLATLVNIAGMWKAIAVKDRFKQRLVPNQVIQSDKKHGIFLGSRFESGKEEKDAAKKAEEDFSGADENKKFYDKGFREGWATYNDMIDANEKFQAAKKKLDVERIEASRKGAAGLSMSDRICLQVSGENSKFGAHSLDGKLKNFALGDKTPPTKIELSKEDIDAETLKKIRLKVQCKEDKPSSTIELHSADAQGDAKAWITAKTERFDVTTGDSQLDMNSDGYWVTRGKPDASQYLGMTPESVALAYASNKKIPTKSYVILDKDQSLLAHDDKTRIALEKEKIVIQAGSKNIEISNAGVVICGELSVKGSVNSKARKVSLEPPPPLIPPSGAVQPSPRLV